MNETVPFRILRKYTIINDSEKVLSEKMQYLERTKQEHGDDYNYEWKDVPIVEECV